ADGVPREPLKLSYVVRITFDERAIVPRYLPWLRAHVGHVCDAGAESAAIVVLDDLPAVESRYVFSSRDAFARYEKEEAPRLRREGIDELARLGVEATYTRTTGEIVT